MAAAFQCSLRMAQIFYIIDRCTPNTVVCKSLGTPGQNACSVESLSESNLAQPLQDTNLLPFILVLI